jgi:predicted DNA-binding transcriptional regulator YafY
MTAGQLASELEVSVRTVYRDVEELSASGIPIFADRGTNGGFQLVEGYRTRLTGLTAEEAETLFLSGYPGPAAQLGLGTVLAAAQLKVLAALPPELRGRASRLRQRFHIDAPAWFEEPDDVPYLQPIAEAVWADRPLHLQYRRAGEDGPIVDRVVDPLGVVLKAGVWYLVARTGADLRTYRVSRIVELDASIARFERPDDFDLAEYWGRSVEAYARSLPSFTATLKVRGDGFERLESVIGRGPAGRPEVIASQPSEGGWLTLSIQLEDLWHAETQLLALGGDVEVVAPPELRESVAAASRAMAAIYG